MEFHIGILPNRPVSECVEIGIEAERLGYHGVWVADSHSIMRDAYAILALLAGRTHTLRLATGVTHTVTRHPAVLANQWATLHEISAGRAILGIGVGESAVHNLGLKPEKLAVFEEKIRVIRALLRGEEVVCDGTAIRMPWSHCTVPVVMACSGPKSLQLAGRIADGVLFQVGSDPRFVAYALENIEAGAARAGRTLADLKLYMRIACALAADPEAARREVRGYAAIAAGTTFATVPRKYFDTPLWDDLVRFKAAYDYAEHGSNQAHHAALLTDRILDAITVVGTADQVVQRFRDLAALGLDGFVWPLGMAQPLPQLQAFAAQVMRPLQH